MGFRITTWNVNGIRNPFSYQPWTEKRTFQAMFDILEADIVVMQETKIQRKDLRDDMVLVPGWDVYFSLPRHKKGYSGVAIYTRNSKCAPIRAEEGIIGVLTAPKSSTSYRDLPKDQHIGGYPRPGQLSGIVDEMTLDSEGRCVALEFPGFVLLGVYSPANRDESRDDFRVGFLEALDIRIRNLVAEGKEVILTGDLNVIRSELDSTNVAESLRKSNMTIEEWTSLPSRRILNQLLFEGSISGERDEGREKPVLWDICRCFHPNRQGMNTCWDTKRNTRPANNGSRIDYVLCSAGLKDWFIDSNIQEGLMGSDHCPVYAVASDTVKVDHRDVALSDLVNPPGMFRDGERLRDWSPKDLLPLSAKLIPEFDRRQSIRDMFTKKANGPTSSQQSQQPPSTPELSNGMTGAQTTPRGTALEDGSETAQGTVQGANIASNSSTVQAQTSSINSTSFLTSPQKASASNKRLAEPADTPPRSKRGKQQAADANANAKLKVAPGQRTLQGFFKPKNATPKEEPRAAANGTNTDAGLSSSANAKPSNHPTKPPPATDDAATAPADREEGAPPQAFDLSKNTNTSDESDGKVFDPIVAKESWSKLLGKRVVPRCDHNEPCISLLTKKPGVNCGRSFYICPRPLGPSGEKEKGSEWRCGTFIWSSDWNGSTSQ